MNGVDNAKHPGCPECGTREHLPECPYGEIARLHGVIATLRGALTKLNEIRNSIVGIQGFNFSEHASPMVVALNEAGFEGLPYPEAKANVGTLIERATQAEDEVERLRSILVCIGTATYGTDEGWRESIRGAVESAQIPDDFARDPRTAHPSTGKESTRK